ncbi:MAG: pyridoxamine 5'-phosphate oxidase, partial [Acidimicrobiales bacterium]|nr:pyridoxamine 5'-phosphate oxidase [Acidimicrobiales bacterium]
MEQRSDLPDLRVSYETAGIDADHLADDPIDQFERWFAEATEGGVFEPNAMVLSTVNADGSPSARTVLLKGLDARGFVFFTNYTSQKSVELIATGRGALTFVWLDLHRQVRIVGPATKVDATESDAYFLSRPRGSRLGAWASDQSTVVPN